MSATMIAPQELEKQAASLDILTQFLSLTKENVAAAGEESRRQMQLTEEEKKKIAEAKAFIAQHASLNADLIKRETILAESHASHKKSVEDHAAFIASENSRLETFAAQLNKKEADQSETDKRHTGEIKKLADDRAEFARQQNEAAAANNAVASANVQAQTENIKAKAANDAEALRLKEWEDKLKAKAKKIRDDAAEF